VLNLEKLPTLKKNVAQTVAEKSIEEIAYIEDSQ